MKPIHVTGLGIYTPGYRDPERWLRQQSDPEIQAPVPGSLSGPLRRRAPGLTRMAVDALEQAAAQAGCDLQTTRTIWATAHGEHSTALRLLGMMSQGEGKLSPTHFHNSVHNTAGGYASIASGNRSASTTLTAGSELVVSAILEAWCHLEASAGEVCVIMADEPLLPPFERSDSRTPLAIGLCLSSKPDGARATLSGLRRDTVAALKPEAPFGTLHVSAALPLFEQIAGGGSGCVALEFERDELSTPWCVDVEACVEQSSQH